MSSEADVYSAEPITVLEGLEPIRRRPGMYIGDVHDGSGLHHMLWEVLGNALDEHLGGRAKRIRVSVEGEVAEVEDDGRGLPIAPYAKGGGVPFVEYALTRLHVDATLDGHFPHVHIGVFGAGLAVVNALSEELEVEVRREGWSWHQRYARGVPLGPLERGTPTERTGTRLRFRADRSIFRPRSSPRVLPPHLRQRKDAAVELTAIGRTESDVQAFDRDLIRRRLQELAAFNPRLVFELMTETIHEPRGIESLLYSLARDNVIDDVFVLPGQHHDDVFVEVALGWAWDWSIASSSSLRSYVGQSKTDAGTHESGFWRGLTRAIRALSSCNSQSLPRRSFRARRHLKGLYAIVHVDLRDPRFGSPTRSRLANREVESIVARVLEEAYGNHLRHSPNLARRVLSRFE